MRPSRRKSGTTGFTLVETMIGLVLLAGLFLIAYKVFSFISNQRSRGSVDLQELQGARHAINYLRRDFRCAAPRIPGSATLAQKRKAMQKPAVETGAFADDGTTPILVSGSEIHFFRQMFGTPDASPSPSMEEVNYRIDPARKCLVRSSAGRELVFPEIKGAQFELYGHPLNPDVPMLLVKLVIDADPKKTVDGRNTLELTSTLSSPVANQNINNPHWNRTYY